MYENIRLINELSIFGRGPDKQQRKKRSVALNTVGGGLLVTGGLAGSAPAYVGIKTLVKDRSMKKRYSQSQTAREDWKKGVKENHPDLATDAKDRAKRTEATQKINEKYAQAKAQKGDVDSWAKKSWKDKFKSTSDDVYDEGFKKYVKRKSGRDVSDYIKSDAYNTPKTRGIKDNIIKNLKRNTKLAAGLSAAGIGVIAANKVLNSNKKKKKR